MIPTPVRSPRSGCFHLAHLLLAISLLILPFSLMAQQTDVARYDVFTGFSYFETPHLNLAEHGFHTQVGMNLKPWLSTGFDYSVVNGHDSLTPNLLTTSLQQQLGAELEALIAEGIIPPTYKISVPVDAFTQTFALGPQLAYRHYKSVTLFIRPSIGAVRQTATPRPADPIASAIVQQLVPSGHKTDWQGFYGVGGGFAVNTTRYLDWRVQTDFVYWHLYDDLLKDGAWTMRFSVGPTFHFGRNIASPATRP